MSFKSAVSQKKLMNQLDFWHDDNNLANIKNGLLVLNGLLMVNVSWT